MSESFRAVRLKVGGMHCRSCSMLVDMTLQDLDGVQSSTTDLGTGVSTVTLDPAVVTVDDLIAAVRAVGYEAEVAE